MSYIPTGPSAAPDTALSTRQVIPIQVWHHSPAVHSGRREAECSESAVPSEIQGAHTHTTHTQVSLREKRCGGLCACV